MSQAEAATMAGDPIAESMEFVLEAMDYHARAFRQKEGVRWSIVPAELGSVGTDDFPNRQLQERVKEMEAAGALAVSLFTGFPHADIHNAGLSVVVATNDDVALAERWRDELLDLAWQDRESFVATRHG